MWQKQSRTLSRPNLTQQPADTIQNKGKRDMKAFRHASLTTFDTQMDTFLTRLQEHCLTDNVMTWYTKWNDMGATMHHMNTRLHSKVLPPMDRYTMAHNTCAFSPKLRYMCGLLEESMYSTDPYVRGKTLIFTRWPIELWLVSLLLTVSGIPHLTTRAGMSAGEKADTYKKSNDPNNESLLLVASTVAAALGVNLQFCCHRLIMMSAPDNINTFIQRIGRLQCVGQRFIQLI